MRTNATPGKNSSGGAHTPEREPKASEVDFSARADPAELPEWMDEPCAYEQFRECVRDLDRVNRWTLGFRPTRRFVKLLAAETYPQRLRVLEVGFGSGTGLRLFGQWARERGLPVKLTGIDLNPMAARAARELTAQAPVENWNGPATWLTGDALTEPAAQGQDVVFSTLVTHHMRDGEIIRFLRWMEETAAVGWFINDVRRSQKSYRIFSWFTRLLRFHAFVKHDGLISIRRGFREADWVRLLGEAGIPPEAVRIEGAVPGRLCLTRLR